MNLEELTQQIHDLVQAKGWYDANTPKPQTMRNLAISLSLEAGEVLEHFQWHEDVADQVGLESELADVALYLIQLASVANIDLEAVILHKIEQNYARKWPEHTAHEEKA